MEAKINSYIAPDLSGIEQDLAVINEHMSTVNTHMEFVSKEIDLFNLTFLRLDPISVKFCCCFEGRLLFVIYCAPRLSSNV